MWSGGGNLRIDGKSRVKVARAKGGRKAAGKGEARVSQLVTPNHCSPRQLPLSLYLSIIHTCPVFVVLSFKGCNGLVLPLYLTMAHFLRGKQAGVQGDLSYGVAPDLFLLDDVSRLLAPPTYQTDGGSSPAMASTLRYLPLPTTLCNPSSQSVRKSRSLGRASSMSSVRSGFALPSSLHESLHFENCDSVQISSSHWTARTMSQFSVSRRETWLQVMLRQDMSTPCFPTRASIIASLAYRTVGWGQFLGWGRENSADTMQVI